jgi:hypothetical protein
MVGYNTGDLCRILTESWNKLKNPCIITWDGSNHDAHQFAELIKAVDIPIMNKLFD